LKLDSSSLILQALAGLALAAIPAANATAAITPMSDSSGMAVIDRLFEGSGFDMDNVPGNHVEYVGMTDAGTQAGLFDSLTLRGANSTTIALGSGIVLSSGRVDNLPTSNTSYGYSNITNTGGNNYFRDFPAQTGTSRHGGRLQEHDENSITFDIFVPEGVAGLSTQFVYASDEFPEWSGTQYADGFCFFVDGVNYARLPDNRPVSLLSQDDNIHFMTNGDALDPLVPTVADFEYDGLTRILELTAPLIPGRMNTITIVVADTGDEIYDSAVFLSSLRFIEGDAPIDPDDCHVRIRHRSNDDDAYIEFAVPAPGAISAFAMSLGFASRRRRR